MVETGEERRSGSDWLIWVLLLVLAALAVWWLGATRDVSDGAGAEGVAANVLTTPPASRVIAAG